MTGCGAWVAVQSTPPTENHPCGEIWWEVVVEGPCRRPLWDVLVGCPCGRPAPRGDLLSWEVAVQSTPPTTWHSNHSKAPCGLVGLWEARPAGRPTDARTIFDNAPLPRPTVPRPPKGKGVNPRPGLPGDNRHEVEGKDLQRATLRPNPGPRASPPARDRHDRQPGIRRHARPSALALRTR